MKAVVVYESMYSNTHRIADAIAAGLRGSMDDVVVVPVGDADRALAEGPVDLLVVGGPTHAHGMSREATRKAAVEAAEKPGSGLELDESAAGPGVRDWLDSMGTLEVPAAAFDTRIQWPEALAGHASKRIGKLLHLAGCELVAPPESFLVDKQSVLVPGERERAESWGLEVGAARRTSERQPASQRSASRK
jgi:hypothetical protein